MTDPRIICAACFVAIGVFAVAVIVRTLRANWNRFIDTLEEQ